MISKNIDIIRKASRQFNSNLTAALSDEAKRKGIRIEADELVCLASLSAPAITIVSSPVAELYKLDLNEFYGGKPILFVYLPDVELKKKKKKIPAGFYTVHFHGDKGFAEFCDERGRTVAEADLQMGLRASGGALARKRVSVDIDGPNLCYKVCAKVCLTVKVDLPGPINPEARVCMEIVIKA